MNSKSLVLSFFILLLIGSAASAVAVPGDSSGTEWVWIASESSSMWSEAQGSTGSDKCSWVANNYGVSKAKEFCVTKSSMRSQAVTRGRLATLIFAAKNDNDFSPSERLAIADMVFCWRDSSSVSGCSSSGYWHSGTTGQFDRLMTVAIENNIGNIRNNLRSSGPANTPSEPAKVASKSGSWTYLGTKSYCSSVSGFQPNLGQGIGWYYCDGADTWYKSCSSGVGDTAGSCDTAVFSVEHVSGNTYNLIPDDGYSIIEGSSAFNIGNGADYTFKLTSSQSDREITLNAPAVTVTDDKSAGIMSTGEPVTVEFSNYNGGTDQYGSIVSKTIEGPDSFTRTSQSSTDDSSPGIERAVFTTSSPGVYQVIGSATDNTPGSGLTAADSTEVWVGDGFTKDYSETFGWIPKADELKQDWEILDGGELRDESTWYDEAEGDHYVNYADIHTPWITDDYISDWSMELKTNYKDNVQNDGYEAVDYDVAVRRSMIDGGNLGMLVTRLKTDINHDGSAAKIVAWSNGNIVYEHSVSSESDFSVYMLEYDGSQATLYKNSQLSMDGRQQIDQAYVSNIDKTGFKVEGVSGSATSTNGEDSLYVDYILAQSGDWVDTTDDCTGTGQYYDLCKSIN